MIKGSLFFAGLTAWSFGGGVVLSAILGTICGVCLVAALIVFEERFDLLDRLCIGGLAGAMILTTPSLFWPTPFDAWSFNLSRGFLALIVLRRFGIPAAIAIHTRRRVALNGAALETRRRHKFRDTK